ncbi:hypothetical protein DBR46_25940 [Pseudomonas sp. KBW05]|nr:hypothetical protein DBR46_25940 [Pseudomonas sp. KBW05]
MGCRSTTGARPGTDKKCGSGLAREGGGSVNTSLTDPPSSRASPLPHLDRCRPEALCTPPIPCGSGLAR